MIVHATFLIIALLAGGATTPVIKRWEPRIVIADASFIDVDGVCVCTGEVFVADTKAKSILVFNGQGDKLRVYGGPSDPERFGEPMGIACQGDRIVLVDRERAEVSILTLDGGVVKKIAGAPGAPFLKPKGVTVGPGGRIFVVDSGSRVFVFDREGNYLHRFGSQGSGPGQLDGAESIAVDAQGRIVVADEGNFRLSVFDANGLFLRTISERGPGPGKFTKDIEGIVVDKRGYIVCLDEADGVVEVFDLEGHVIATIGNGAGQGPGKLNSPDGMAYDMETDRLWIGDQGNKRVQCFDLGPLLGQTEATPPVKAALPSVDASHCE